MIPSRRWFPGTLQERSAWYTNFSQQLDAVGASLGFTVAELLLFSNDKDALNFLAGAAPTIEAYTDAIRHYRLIVTEGDIGTPTPAFPADLALAGMLAPVPTGIFERLDNAVKRIRAAPAYTNEIGALLGIIPSAGGGGENLGPDVVKPVIKAGESFQDYKFNVNVTRLGYEAFKVQISRSSNGNGTWVDAAFATSNPCVVTVTPTTEGQPERISVRAQLLDKNVPVGEPSDPTIVTINP